VRRCWSSWCAVGLLARGGRPGRCPSRADLGPYGEDALSGGHRTLGTDRADTDSNIDGAFFLDFQVDIPAAVPPVKEGSLERDDHISIRYFPRDEREAAAGDGLSNSGALDCTGRRHELRAPGVYGDLSLVLAKPQMNLSIGPALSDTDASTHGNESEHQQRSYTVSKDSHRHLAS